MKRGGRQRRSASSARPAAGTRGAAPFAFKGTPRSLSLFVFLFLFLFVSVSVPGAAAAAGPAVPPAPTRFVTDKAGILPGDAAARLEARLQSFEKETSNQFLVYTETAVPDGTTLEEYTVACAQSWKAGQAQRKNGMILFVFPGSRKVRLEVGYGLEGAMPDALARRVLDEQVLPRFRSGDYAGGVAAGVDAAIAATRGEYKGTGRTQGQKKRGSEGISIPLPLVLILLFLFFFVFLPAIRGGRRGSFWYINGGGFGGGGFGGGGFGGGSFGGGGGGFSGGGGSFGGGGASGDW